ncbi:hypothetical protein [Streptomyces sp. NPDC059460]|uniref:hypothetical protein n=1 Tax=Streptomyces sp. NPDC059460 TaxID=3346840 RepID=UPI003689A8BC
MGAVELEVASFGRLPVAHLKDVGDAGPGDPVRAGQGDEHQFARIQLVAQRADHQQGGEYVGVGRGWPQQALGALADLVLASGDFP